MHPAGRAAYFPVDAVRALVSCNQVDRFNTDLFFQGPSAERMSFGRDIPLRPQMALLALLVDFFLVRFFLVASGVFGFSSLEHLQSYSNDHSEPYQQDNLQRQQRCKESPLDAVIPAHKAFRIFERLDKVIEVIGHMAGAFEVGAGATIASVRDLLRDIRIDGPANKQIQDMPRSEPDEHEDAECDVASGLEVKVFE